MTITPYKKKDGKTYYMLKAYGGIDPKTGKTRYICRRGFSTRKDAQVAYITLTSPKDTIKTTEKLTYRDIFEMWFEEQKTQVKDSTQIVQLGLFRNHILPAIGDYIISKIEHRDMLKAMIEWSKTYSRVNHIKAYAGAVFKYALLHGYTDKNPLAFVKIPKKQEEKPFRNFFDKEELRLFLEIAEKELSPKFSALLHLLAFTGLRRGEALALEWSDIDFNLGILSITKNLSISFGKYVVSSTKTKAGTRIISLGNIILGHLKAYKAVCESNTLVFPKSKGEHMTPQIIAEKIKLLCNKAGLKYISPHGLRHTHCCLLFEAGASIAQVQQRLGHNDSKMTLEVYNHVTKGKVKEAADIFENYIF